MFHTFVSALKKRLLDNSSKSTTSFLKATLGLLRKVIGCSIFTNKEWAVADIGWRRFEEFGKFEGLLFYFINGIA